MTCEDCEKQLDIEAIKKSLMEYIDNYVYDIEKRFRDEVEAKLIELKKIGEKKENA